MNIDEQIKRAVDEAVMAERCRLSERLARMAQKRHDRFGLDDVTAVALVLVATALVDNE